jgi:hypothetical protein
MTAARVADEDGVRPLGEAGVERGKGLDSVPRLHVRARFDLKRVRDDITTSERSNGEELEILAEECPQVADVALPDASEADDQDLQVALSGRTSLASRKDLFAIAHRTSSPGSPRAA